MIKPVRIQRSRKKKQVSPNGLPIVYVGRPGKWGNPYHVVHVAYERYNVLYVKDGLEILVAICIPKDIALKVAVDSYRQALNENDVKELKGKNLSCWCKPGEPCHADVLLEIANK